MIPGSEYLYINNTQYKMHDANDLNKKYIIPITWSDNHHNTNSCLINVPIIYMINKQGQLISTWPWNMEIYKTHLLFDELIKP